MNIPQIMGLRLMSPLTEQKQQRRTSSFGLTMAVPLLKDTVSFGINPNGTTKSAAKSLEVNVKTAKAVHSKLIAAEKHVETFMENLFGDLKVSDKEPNNPILSISTRLKSEKSIKEKTGSYKLNNAQEIEEFMNDLLGSKITLQNSNPIVVDNTILARLIPQIKSRTAEILEIENKRPIAAKSLPEYEANKYDYGSVKMMEKLATIQNQVWKAGGSKQKVKTELTDDFQKANYCATHYIIRLPGKKPVKFELQIIGKNMNIGKHVDDPVYKKLNGKQPAFESKEFDKLFEPFTNPKFFEAEPNAEEIVKNAREKLNKYRAEVLLFQRTKADMPYSKKKSQEIFLPISYQLFPNDIEIKYGISSTDFDYNNLYKIIQRAEKNQSKNTKPKNK